METEKINQSKRICLEIIGRNKHFLAVSGLKVKLKNYAAEYENKPFIFFQFKWASKI